MTDRKIGIGTVDFKEIILEGKYYIDKTNFIKEVIDDGSKVLLITRPRRFGKTLNMSMLKYYFDINGKYNKELFEGLNITKHGEKYINEMSKYPVIDLSFVDVKEVTYENMVKAVRCVVADLYLMHEYLLSSEKISGSEKERIKEIINYKADEVTLKRSIKELSKYLEKHYGQSVVLLIDEYDVPLQTAYAEGYYEEASKFVKGIYSSALKDNTCIKKAVLTRRIKNCKRKYI